MDVYGGVNFVNFFLYYGFVLWVMMVYVVASILWFFFVGDDGVCGCFPVDCRDVLSM